MDNLALRDNNVPMTINELSKFVLIGREKLASVRSEIRAIQKVGLAKEVLAQKRLQKLAMCNSRIYLMLEQTKGGKNGTIRRSEKSTE